MSIVFCTFTGRVVRATDKAVLYRFEDTDPTLPGFPPRDPYEHWIPRACCQDGDTLDEGSTDICIADWFCEKEGIA